MQRPRLSDVVMRLSEDSLAVHAFHHVLVKDVTWRSRDKPINWRYQTINHCNMFSLQNKYNISMIDIAVHHSSSWQENIVQKLPDMPWRKIKPFTNS